MLIFAISLCITPTTIEMVSTRLRSLAGRRLRFFRLGHDHIHCRVRLVVVSTSASRRCSRFTRDSRVKSRAISTKYKIHRIIYKNILPQQHICIQSSAQELSIAVLSVFNLLLDRDFRKLIDNNYINFRNSTRADFSQKNYLRVHDNAFPIQKQQKAAISHSVLEQRKII